MQASIITYTVALLLIVAQAGRAEESAPQSVEHAQPGSQQSVQPQASASGEPVQASGQEHAPVQHYGQQPPSAAYYSPAAGVITVVGNDHYQPGSIANKPIGISQVVPSGGQVQGPIRHYASQVVPPVQAEQYGQPESSSIPTNYKPFGSWGLYIGGNPADGYYTNYYKSLGSSVEKQQVGGQQAVAPESSSGPKPQVGGQQVNPTLRQASGSVYGVGPDVYPFDNAYYTPADLSSGIARFASPFQAGAQGYGTPSASFEPSSSLSYADPSFYSSKRPGGGQQQQQQVQQVQQQQQSKGYQARSGYAYASPVVAAGQVSQPQVVAYPVPVGSQIVGSQPGVEGGFQPYGVHAFTRYAVKPTVVASPEQSAYYAPPAFVGAYPTYNKQQQQQVVAAAATPQQQQQQYPYQPFGFYGYPISQLHYSSGSIGQVGVQQGGSPVSVYSPSSVVPMQEQGVSSIVGHHHSPVEIVAASEKHETTQDKSASEKQHQKA